MNSSDESSYDDSYLDVLNSCPPEWIHGYARDYRYYDNGTYYYDEYNVRQWGDVFQLRRGIAGGAPSSD